MPKTIRIDERVYERLDTFQKKHESKSGAVSRLLDLSDTIGMLKDTLEGVRPHGRQPAEPADEAQCDGAGEDSEQVPVVPAG